MRTSSSYKLVSPAVPVRVHEYYVPLILLVYGGVFVCPLPLVVQRLLLRKDWLDKTHRQQCVGCVLQRTWATHDADAVVSFPAECSEYVPEDMLCCVLLTAVTDCEQKSSCTYEACLYPTFTQTPAVASTAAFLVVVLSCSEILRVPEGTP